MPYEKFHLFSRKRILILLISTLIPYSIHGMDNDSIIAADQEQAVIYVQNGAEVYGLPELTNALVSKTTSSDSTPKHAEKKERTDSTFAMKIEEKKQSQKKVLKKLQDQINNRISHFYYSDSESTALFSGKVLQLNNVATNVLVTSQDIKGIASSNDFIILTLRLHLAKQKFYTSLSYLEFGKLRNSFLRGPPTV